MIRSGKIIAIKEVKKVRHILDDGNDGICQPTGSGPY